MFELPEEIKKISAGKIEFSRTREEVEERAHQHETEDRQAKRALKRKRQRQRKKEQRLKQQQEDEEEANDLKGYMTARGPKKDDPIHLDRENKNDNQNDGQFYKEHGSSQNTPQKKEPAENKGKWSLKDLNPTHMMLLNEKLSEYQDVPRHFSEPKKKYYPSPDLRPEVVEALDEDQRQALIMSLEQRKLNLQPMTSFYDVDINSLKEERSLLSNFLTYRKKFEQSQQIRLES